MPRDEIIFEFSISFLFNNKNWTRQYSAEFNENGILVKQTFMRQERIFNEFLLFTDIEMSQEREQTK